MVVVVVVEMMMCRVQSETGGWRQWRVGGVSGACVCEARCDEDERRITRGRMRMPTERELRSRELTDSG